MGAIIDIIRNANGGKLPSYTAPGSYPVLYVTRECSVLCPTCANTDDSDDPIESCDVNWENASLFCDGCSERIESAYAEDDVVREG